MNESTFYIPALLFFTALAFAVIIFTIVFSKREKETKNYSIQLRCSKANYKCLKQAYDEQSKELLELKKQKAQKVFKEFSSSFGKHIIIKGSIVAMEAEDLNSVTLTIEKEDTQIIKVIIPKSVKF